MKSKRLSFNKAVSRNVIRRCWPLWLVYLGYLLVTFNISILSFVQRNNMDTEDFLLNGKALILSNAVFQTQVSIGVAIIAVMVLFGYLYNSRGNTLMNCLPVTRECVFLTIYLTGVAPMLLCQLLVTGLAMLMTISCGFGVKAYLQWLACTALGFVAFYGFAVFCAMLTGNIVILPIVYVVLNFAAVGFEMCVKRCLSVLVFGMESGQMHFNFLSPIVEISDGVRTVNQFQAGIWLEGMEVLEAYAAAGLVFALFALMLYRKRRMETVSDFVAIPVLKPIFRYCMGFGGAVLFAALMYENFFDESIYGRKAAWLMAGLLLIGALLGWIVAEMMIRRTVRSFPLPWKGLVLVCIFCLMAVFAAENDITGYERKVPEPDRVERIEFDSDTAFFDPENIRAVTKLHQEIIHNKQLYDEGESSFRRIGVGQKIPAEERLDPNRVYSYWMPIRYVMKDGTVLTRLYTLLFHAEEVDRPESVIGQVRALLNTAEGIRSRMAPGLPMEAENISYAVINRETPAGYDNSYRMTPEETLELWETAMIPDAEEGNLSLYTIADTEENLSTQTNLTIDINLFDPSHKHDPSYWFHSYRVFTFSEHCLEWIEEHANLEWETMTELLDKTADPPHS